MYIKPFKNSSQDTSAGIQADDIQVKSNSFLKVLMSPNLRFKAIKYLQPECNAVDSLQDIYPARAPEIEKLVDFDYATKR